MLQSLFENIDKTREQFHQISNTKTEILDISTDLFFEIVNLTRAVATEGDDERYFLEVLMVAFRRVLGSLVLLESGLPQEAHIVLRNAIEFMLIGIDINYNAESLKEWEKTRNEDLKTASLENWYFTKSKICTRIRLNPNNIYPELEVVLVLGEEKQGKGLCKEWERISNMSLHAHSQAQIKGLFDDRGSFQLLGLKNAKSYELDFRQYAKFISNITNLLIGIPKYRERIGKSSSLAGKARRFVSHYNALREQMKEEIPIEWYEKPKS